MSESLRFPVRLTWWGESRYLYYRVVIWCQETYPADGYEIDHLPGNMVIDFEHASDRTLFMLKWGEYSNEL